MIFIMKHGIKTKPDSLCDYCKVHKSKWMALYACIPPLCNNNPKICKEYIPIKKMTNKQLQEALAQFPDDYNVCIDTTFSWETPDSKNKVIPHLFVNSDAGEIEIGVNADRERGMQLGTIEKVAECIFSEWLVKMPGNMKSICKNALNKFNEKYA